MKYGLVFIGGCPRSGTTAVQLFLGSHPEIVTVRETHLFDRYIGPFFRKYKNEAQSTKSDDGIRMLLSESSMVDWCRALAESVFEKILTLKSGAKIVLEKTPGNTLYGREIAKVFPKSCFISVVRDPRGVAESFLAASCQAWGAWAADNANAAAQRWLRAIETLPVLDRAFGKRHFLIRYEDLMNPKLDARSRLIEFLASQFPEQTFESSQFALPEVGSLSNLGLSDDQHNPTREARTEFFRRGTPDGWHTELTIADMKTIERVCGSAMQEFGYANT